MPLTCSTPIPGIPWSGLQPKRKPEVYLKPIPSHLHRLAINPNESPIMKKITLYLLFASVFTSFAWATPRTDALAYLNALNAKWVVKDYAGLKAVTDARLEATSEGDLVSILEYCCYLSIFDPNLEVIKQYANKGLLLLENINWTNAELSKLYVKAMLDEAKNPEDALQDGMIIGATSEQIAGLHAESPNRYPLID